MRDGTWIPAQPTPGKSAGKPPRAKILRFHPKVRRRRRSGSTALLRQYPPLVPVPLAAPRGCHRALGSPLMRHSPGPCLDWEKKDPPKSRLHTPPSPAAPPALHSPSPLAPNPVTPQPPAPQPPALPIRHPLNSAAPHTCTPQPSSPQPPQSCSPSAPHLSGDKQPNSREFWGGSAASHPSGDPLSRHRTIPETH